MPGCPPRLHLPYAEWPAEDRRLWEEAIGGGDDPFADGAGAHLAAASQKRYLFGWRRWLGFLALEEPTALDLGPAERLTMERVRRFAAHLAETNLPQSVAAQVDALYKAARTMLSDCDWSWLKAIKTRLYAVPPVQSAKPVITSLLLLELGLRLMDENWPKPGIPFRLDDAVRYRDGLMIAFLAFIPPRRKNLAALEIGRHLIREDDAWFIIVPGAETKTGSAAEFVVPEALEPLFATYLEVVRPRMLRRPWCPALWVSRKGGPLSYSAIWFIIDRHSREQLGLHIAPHDARDAAATTWAVAMPDQIGVARDLLIHADLRMTRPYILARGLEASRAYGEVIARLRKNHRTRRTEW